MKSVVPQHKHEFFFMYIQGTSVTAMSSSNPNSISNPPLQKILMKYSDIKQKHGMGMGGMCPIARVETWVSV
jgi:hypothetical protein